MWQPISFATIIYLPNSTYISRDKEKYVERKKKKRGNIKERNSLSQEITPNPQKGRIKSWSRTKIKIKILTLRVKKEILFPGVIPNVKSKKGWHGKASKRTSRGIYETIIVTRRDKYFESARYGNGYDG